VVIILVFSGLGAIAIPIEKPTKNQPLNTQDWPIEIKVKCGLFGYKVTVKNVCNETVSGDLSITITTQAPIMLSGVELSLRLRVTNDFDEESILIGPILGFGPANINLEARFTYESGDYVKDSINIKGFVFLFYISCDL
jgi:hypothetical protein